MPVAEMESDLELPLLLERQNLGFLGDEASQDDLMSVAPPGSPPGQQRTSSKAIIGIIYPPPEVRNIVDKTATFVARNGPEFESRIKTNEQGNSKFNFLVPGDPYHGYYQHKVKEIQEGRSAPPPTPLMVAAAEVKTTTLQLIDEAKKKKQSDLLSRVELPFVPKEPPLEFEFVGEPPSISAHDLDVVKLTAQFVARNGRQFLSTLMTREQRNYQFDFLRPQHSLFQYFTRLLDQYTKVLIPPKDIAQKLGGEQRGKILTDVKYRANWIKHQEAQRRKIEEEIEKERMAYSCIDWHDFVVVETVEYQPFEQGQFPPPTNPEEVGARVLLQDRILQGQEKELQGEDEPSVRDDTEVKDMEEDSSSSGDDADEDDEGGSGVKPDPEAIHAQEQNRLMGASAEPPKEDQVIIRKGYDPKKLIQAGPQMPADRRMDSLRTTAGSRPEEYTISPITGERIPVSKLDEHMRIGLLDPRWRDQRDRQLMDRVNHESVYAPGGAIEESLKQLAERRSDIFGVGVEETPIGKKMGEEERIPGMPWDPMGGMGMSGGQGNDGMEDSRAVEEPKKEPIGPSMESQPQQGQFPKLSQGGILQPPPNAVPQMPQLLSGIVRPSGGQQVLMPPQGMMMMQGMQQRMGMPPLLGQHPGHPGYPPAFPNPPPPGTGHRPPLLANAPPMPPMPPPPQMPPPPMTMLQQHQQQQHQPPPPPPEDEPANKKTKTLEDSLIPESVFLATNKATTTFLINMPNMPDKPELNLAGQLMTVTLGLTDSVTTLKQKINDLIGLAPGKQKLRLTEGLFFKDSFSLAYYNVGEGTTVHLSLKERGGRKK